jgi:hypothetical protein
LIAFFGGSFTTEGTAGTGLHGESGSFTTESRAGTGLHGGAGSFTTESTAGMGLYGEAGAGLEDWLALRITGLRI